MNKFSFLILLLLFTVFACLGAGTALCANGLIDSSALQVNLTNQNPDPAHPGEPVELTLSVQNIGNNVSSSNSRVKSKFPIHDDYL
jgi:hypothetical protein